MKPIRLARLVSLIGLASLLGASNVPAQLRPGVFGFTVSGVHGSAGEFCWTFDCVPRRARADRGETLDLVVRAPWSAPYAIGISPGAGSCLQLPFIGNQLVLDSPLFLAALGRVNQPSPIKACYGGVQRVPLRIPRWVPPGFQFALQAVAVVPTERGMGPAFSVAILITIE